MLSARFGRVDELQLVGQLLADRQPRAGIGLVGDQLRLDADLAEAGRLLETAAEREPDAAGQIRQHLLARDLVLLAAHLVERAAGHEHRHDVGLGQRRIGGQRRLGLARRRRSRRW